MMMPLPNWRTPLETTMPPVWKRFEERTVVVPVPFFTRVRGKPELVRVTVRFPEASPPPTPRREAEP